MKKDDQADEAYIQEVKEIRETIRRRREQGKGDKVFKHLIDPADFKLTGKCHICSKPVKDSSENVCKFCGKNVCGDCSPKKRQDPSQKNKDQTKKGVFLKICDKCDHLYIKELLVGQHKEEAKRVDRQVQEEQKTFQEINTQFLQIQQNLQVITEQVKKEGAQSKAEREEKLEDIVKKVDAKKLKIEKEMERITIINEERRQLAEKLKEMQEKQTNVLDDINNRRFEKSQLEKKELSLDTQSTQLKDFLCSQNAQITQRNLNKKYADSTLARRTNDSQMESNYNVFQDTPDTPLESFMNFNTHRTSNMEIASSSKLFKGGNQQKKK